MKILLVGIPNRVYDGDVLPERRPAVFQPPANVRPAAARHESLLKGGLKLSHMRIMAVLDEHGQISAAAQILNISQPAASRMIGEMEAILGVELCERLPRGVRLTAYGRALARRARAVLLELHEVDREIMELKSGQGGSVFMGSVTAPAIELAVPAIRRVRGRFPKMEINVQIETSTVLARELLASRHDFIIARIPDDLNPRLFESRVIGIEKACLVVREGHPLLGRGPVSMEELSDYDWVFQPGGSLLRRTIEALFIANGAPLPERVLNTSSVLLSLVMVSQSDAIAPIATDVARFIGSEGLGGAVEVLPIAFDIEVQPFSLIMARNRTLSPAAQTLYDEILAQIGEPADAA